MVFLYAFSSNLLKRFVIVLLIDRDCSLVTILRFLDVDCGEAVL
jgi:hypothetical protein